MISKKFILLVLGGLLFSGYSNLFCQNPRADGYKGLWSKSITSFEYGYKYSGGMATFSAQHLPVAVYSPAEDKTFFVYSGTSDPAESHLQIMVSYFDHRNNKVPRPVIVYDKMGVNDPQDNASMSVDGDGYIWIFVSGRGRTRPGLIFKSRTPYSIDAFDKAAEGEIVFPQPWWMNDSCFLVMHIKVRQGRELYWTTGTDGSELLSGQKLAGMGGHYQVTGVFGKKLVSVFNYFPGGNIDKRTNLYLLQTEDLGKTWKTIDNKVITTPVTDTHSEALIRDFESEKKLVFIKDLNFDASGNPVILAIISNDYRPGPSGMPREWMVISRKNNEWNFSKVCESSHNYDMGSLFITENGWQIIAPTEPGPEKDGAGGEIAEWVSRDNGETWQKALVLTSGSKWNNSYVRRPLNANREFFAFWADGNTRELSESRLYFTDQGCKKVWVLPYSMKKDFEKPVRIKAAIKAN